MPPRTIPWIPNAVGRSLRATSATPISIVLAVLFTTLASISHGQAQDDNSSQGSPPNIVLIVSDDQGYADLGIIGRNSIQTPNLDRLCREGVRLTNFYVTWPACTPSRGSLLTGRYPQRHGVYDMIRNEAPDYGYRYTPAEYEVTFERIGGMDTREVLLPRMLSWSGYTSGIFGKWDLGSLKRFLPLARGFDDFYGFVNTGIDYYTHERYGVPSMYRNNDPTQADRGTYATHLFEREALRFLETNWQRPFLLYLPFNAPHNSSSLDPKIRGTIQAPDDYKALYPPIDEEFREGTRYGKPALVPTREARQRDYRAAVTCMDASIGDVLDFLDDKGIAETTFVFFLADNGGGGGSDNYPLRGGKGQMFEGGLRVCAAARWPGRIPAGTVNDAFLTSLEIFPTLAAATNTPLPNHLRLDGFNMLPVLQGSQPSPREEMFWERKTDRAARVGSWKWVESSRGGGLFNLDDDASESQDLSAQHPEILERLKTRYNHWKQNMQEAPPRGPFRDF